MEEIDWERFELAEDLDKWEHHIGVQRQDNLQDSLAAAQERHPAMHQGG